MIGMLVVRMLGVEISFGVELIGVGLTIVLCLIFGIIAARGLRRAGRELTDEERSLKSWKSVKTTEDIEKVLCEKKSGSKELDLVSKAVDSLVASREVRPDLEAIATFLAQEEAALLTFPRAAPNLMFVSGLLGTVVGVLLTIYQLGGQIETVAGSGAALGAAEIVDRLGHVFAPMSWAFGATIIGIICSLFFALWTSRVARRQSELLARVQEFVLTDMAPIVLPKPPENVFAVLKQTVQQSRDLLKKIPQTLEAAATRLEQSMATAESGISRAVEALFSVCREVTASTHEISKAADSIQTGMVALGQSVQDLRLYHQELREVYGGLASEFEASRKHLDEVVERQIQSANYMREEFSNRASEMIGQVAVVGDSLSGIDNQVRELTESIQTSLDRLWADTRHQFDGVFERVQGVVESYKHSLVDTSQALHHNLDRVVIRLEELSARLDPRLLPEDEWRKVSSGIQALGDFAHEVAALQQVLIDLKTQLDKMRRVPSDTFVGGRDSGNGVVDKLGRMEAHLNRIEELLSKLGRIEEHLSKLSHIRNVDRRDTGPRDESTHGGKSRVSIFDKIRSRFRLR